MFVVAFDCYHNYPDMQDRDKCWAEFNSLDDALMFAAFYHNKVEETDIEGYSRDWSVRGIYAPCHKSAATLKASDIPDGFAFNGQTFRYEGEISSTCDLTWDQVDALPVASFPA